MFHGHPNLTQCYQVGAEKFGWSKQKATPGSLRDGDWLMGVGMATALYPAYRSKSSAKVGFLADGTAQVSAATHDLGTGIWTVLAIVGAESLGLPLERIRPALGDSALPAAPLLGALCPLQVLVRRFREPPTQRRRN